MTTFAQVKSWSANGAEDAADQLVACSKKLGELLRTFEDDGVPEGWSGNAMESASAAHNDLCTSLEGYLDQVQKAKNAVTAAEGKIAAVAESVHAVLAEASRNQFSIDDVGAVHDVHPVQEFDEPVAADAFLHDRQTQQQHLSAEVSRILAEADHLDTAMAGSVFTIANAPGAQYDNGNSQGTLPPEVVAAWKTMSEEERRKVLQRLADEYADRYGIPHTTIQFANIRDAEDVSDPTDPDSHVFRYGYWREGTRQLVIDASDVSDPLAAINTVAHEMRHAGQNEMARDANPNFIHKLLIDWGWVEDPFQHPDVTRAQAKEWGDNFDHYNSPPEDPYDSAGWADYLKQPVETDARTIGEQEVNKMTLDRLNELRK